MVIAKGAGTVLAMSVFPGSALSSAWSCLWKAGRRPGGRKEGNATKGCQPGRPSRCHPTHSFLSFLLSYYSHSHHPQQHHRDLEECLKIVSQRERRGGGGGTWEPLVCVCWGPTLCSSAGLPLHSRVQCSQVDSHGSPCPAPKPGFDNSTPTYPWGVTPPLLSIHVVAWGSRSGQGTQACSKRAFYQVTGH